MCLTNCLDDVFAYDGNGLAVAATSVCVAFVFKIRIWVEKFTLASMNVSEADFLGCRVFRLGMRNNVILPSG